MVISFAAFSNARLACDQHVLPQLTPWLEMNHITDLSDDILMDALSKAEMDLMQRRKMEYQSWATCKSREMTNGTW